MIKAEIGKYYADENSIIRVDELDHCNEPLGVLILSNETNVSIDHFVDIHYMFYEENTTLKEITKEEFEAKLLEFQAKSNELFNELIKQ